MRVAQSVEVYVINLARRPDRLERIGALLAERGVAWQRIEACDALQADAAEFDRWIMRRGPLGPVAHGDRACTVSHMTAWQRFLAGPASHALFLEDDIYLSADLASVLADPGWIPPGIELVKLEKYGDGVSRILLGPTMGNTPGGRRALHRMHSRHVGGGAYILTRKGAEIALSQRGRARVTIDHLLFNDTVSPIFRRLRPAVIRPAMATQRHYGYNSDIAPLTKAARPRGLKLWHRKLRRGLSEVRQVHRQLFALATGQARPMDLVFREEPED